MHGSHCASMVEKEDNGVSEDGLGYDGRIHLSRIVTQWVCVSQRHVRHHKSLFCTMLQPLSPTQPTVHNLPFANPI